MSENSKRTITAKEYQDGSLYIDLNDLSYAVDVEKVDSYIFEEIDGKIILRLFDDKGEQIPLK